MSYTKFRQVMQNSWGLRCDSISYEGLHITRREKGLLRTDRQIHTDR